MVDSITEQFSAQQRNRGAFYTPSSASEFMAAWILEGNPRTVLEPCFGQGNFLVALNKISTDLGRIPPRMIGVEIDEQAFSRTVTSGILQSEDAILDDFLQVKPTEVDAVVGNPPYVRLRHMGTSESAVAMAAAAAQLGFDMDPSGSVWMPFVAHAVPFLRRGGRLALVLPLDITYVRYARPLWQYLASQFGHLELIRSRERVFPDLLQDVVVLMANNKGATCSTVRYRAYSRVADFLRDDPTIDQDIAVSDIAEGKRPFMWAHLQSELRQLLAGPLASNLIPSRELVRFNIGYVAGDKSFFHPSTDARARFGLRDESLIPSLSSSRNLRNAGLYTSGMPDHAVDCLFLPPEDETGVADADLIYIKHGEELGIHQRYKCRVRDPWYIVPYVKSPDVVLTVFTERPILAVNDARFVASNSLLCGYLEGIDACSFAARWYTSVTLLHIEVEVHSLGGGVMILVPRETGNVRIVNHPSIPKSGLTRIDQLLAAGDAEGAYRIGDEVVLKRTLGLSDADIDLLHDGIATLAHWRTSARTLDSD